MSSQGYTPAETIKTQSRLPPVGGSVLSNHYEEPYTLLLDMDGIIVDILSMWLKKYNDKTGSSINVGDITMYNMESFCTNKKALYEVLAEENFFYNLPPMPGAIQAINDLIESEYNYDIVILTQPPYDSEYGVRDKERWIKKYLPNFKKENIIYSHRKSMIRGDVLFDDNNNHLESWSKQNPSGKLATLDWKYTKNYKVDFMGSTQNGWCDFVNFVNCDYSVKLQNNSV